MKQIITDKMPVKYFVATELYQEGDYKFVDERTSHIKCGFCDKCLIEKRCSNVDAQNKLFGIAHLKPIAINPSLIISRDKKSCFVEIVEWDNRDDEYFGTLERIDKETYDDIKENYIDKGIDYIVYEVSDVKGGE